jgi:FtsP/CotA-like multicopper oxidase with cupredoxin domain
VRQVSGSFEMQGLNKDVALDHAKSTTEVEFLADNPGKALFYCHQQDHMARGFMMMFRYA